VILIVCEDSPEVHTDASRESDMTVAATSFFSVLSFGQALRGLSSAYKNALRLFRESVSPGHGTERLRAKGQKCSTVDLAPPTRAPAVSFRLSGRPDQFGRFSKTSFATGSAEKTFGQPT
jgi:hypothetical protein